MHIPPTVLKAVSISRAAWDLNREHDEQGLKSMQALANQNLPLPWVPNGHAKSERVWLSQIIQESRGQLQLESFRNHWHATCMTQRQDFPLPLLNKSPAFSTKSTTKSSCFQPNYYAFTQRNIIPKSQKHLPAVLLVSP